MAKHNRYDINLFVIQWNECNSIDEMQAKWPGVSKANLAARASKLRAQGYDLQNLRDKSSFDEFVAVVNASASIEEAATKLETTLEHVKVRASQLRRQGVDVRSFRRFAGGNDDGWEGLLP